MHNLTKVFRDKSDAGLFSDYPHFFKFKLEGKADYRMFGVRNSENGEFIISCQEVIFNLYNLLQGVFCQYGRNYVGEVVPNFLGTRFEVFDYGMDPAYILKDIPKDFLPTKKKMALIEYDSNFFAEKPRSFRITLYDS